MKILLGMSGGLDSTYAAKKLKDMGHEVEGAILVMHEHTDVDSAKSAATTLGIPLHIIDCKELFKEKVKIPFAKDYACGRTPNPCIICNPEVKFFALTEYARLHGFDRIATGHYAKIVEYCTEEGTRMLIARPKDKAKDQTYMLYRLPQNILNILLLPLSDEVKSTIRDTIRGSDISEFDRPDSQEICFLPDQDYAPYVESVMGEAKIGNFINNNGEILGEHKGIIHYTIGQRKGLGIALGQRAFVTEINSIDNTVTLDTSPKYTKIIKLTDVVYNIPMVANASTARYDVKVRYLSSPTSASVTIYLNGTADVILDGSVKSVTPGQSCVFYDGDVVVGGGIIQSCE